MDKVEEYIQSERALGKDDAAIKQQLAASGWQDKDLEKYFIPSTPKKNPWSLITLVIASLFSGLVGSYFLVWRNLNRLGEKSTARNFGIIGILFMCSIYLFCFLFLFNLDKGATLFITLLLSALLFPLWYVLHIQVKQLHTPTIRFDKALVGWMVLGICCSTFCFIVGTVIRIPRGEPTPYYGQSSSNGNSKNTSSDIWNAIPFNQSNFQSTQYQSGDVTQASCFSAMLPNGYQAVPAGKTFPNEQIAVQPIDPAKNNGYPFIVITFIPGITTTSPHVFTSKEFEDFKTNSLLPSYTQPGILSYTQTVTTVALADGNHDAYIVEFNLADGKTPLKGVSLLIQTYNPQIFMSVQFSGYANTWDTDQVLLKNFLQTLGLGCYASHATSYTGNSASTTPSVTASGSGLTADDTSSFTMYYPSYYHKDVTIGQYVYQSTQVNSLGGLNSIRLLDTKDTITDQSSCNQLAQQNVKAIANIAGGANSTQPSPLSTADFTDNNGINACKISITFPKNTIVFTFKLYVYAKSTSPEKNYEETISYDSNTNQAEVADLNNAIEKFTIK